MGQLGAGTYTAYLRGMGGVAVGVGVLMLIAVGQVRKEGREGGSEGGREEGGRESRSVHIVALCGGTGKGGKEGGKEGGRACLLGSHASD